MLADSFIDIIFGERQILMAVVFALLPMILAIVIWLTLRLRAVARKRIARYAERIQAAPSGDFDLPYLPHREAPDSEEAAEPLAAPVDDLPDGAGDTFDEEAEEEDDAVSSAMQDLLSSVFSDSEYSGQYEDLLQELPEVGTADLVMLCNLVSSQLRTPAPDEIEVREGENGYPG